MRRRARGGAGCQATAPLRLVRRRGRGSATPLPLLHLLCGLLNASYRFIKKIRAALEAYTKRARHVCEHFLQTTTIISRYMSSPMMTRVGMKHIKKYVEMMTHDNVSRGVLVLQQNPTPFAKSFLIELEPKIHLKVFQTSRTMWRGGDAMD